MTKELIATKIIVDKENSDVLKIDLLEQILAELKTANAK